MNIIVISQVFSNNKIYKKQLDIFKKKYYSFYFLTDQDTLRFEWINADYFYMWPVVKQPSCGLFLLFFPQESLIR